MKDERSGKGNSDFNSEPKQSVHNGGGRSDYFPNFLTGKKVTL